MLSSQISTSKLGLLICGSRVQSLLYFEMFNTTVFRLVFIWIPFQHLHILSALSSVFIYLSTSSSLRITSFRDSTVSGTFKSIIVKKRIHQFNCAFPMYDEVCSLKIPVVHYKRDIQNIASNCYQRGLNYINCSVSAYFIS